MRFEKAEDLLNLAFAMQSNGEGVSLADIEEMFEVSRRTAMRMRDAVVRVYPQTEESVDEGRIKRWRISSATNGRHLALTPDELATLDMASKAFNGRGLRLQAKALRSLAGKIKSFQKCEASRRIEPDLEALIEAEGLAARPGPRPKIDPEHLHKLREAIKACKIVDILYRGKGKAEASVKRVAPYGFLYGHRHYLVGGGTEKGRETARYHFILSQIEGVMVMKEGFSRDRSFDIQAYAEQSFGIWHEKSTEVVWRFTPHAAEAARDFVFHPKQKVTIGKDGSMTVRFKAGGLLEMAWHLYMWGDQVEVIKPAVLKKMLDGHQHEWEGLP
ncbi:MAG: WYL domain-containing protein [Alphaproteobacteria bacterium]|nr:WYL domain-containing protein [Alphaproteobacteria bacterium]